MDKEITLKDIEDDYEAFCSFDRHDERVGWLIKRARKLEDGIAKIGAILILLEGEPGIKIARAGKILDKLLGEG